MTQSTALRPSWAQASPPHALAQTALTEREHPTFPPREDGAPLPPEERAYIASLSHLEKAYYCGNRTSFNLSLVDARSLSLPGSVLKFVSYTSGKPYQFNRQGHCSCRAANRDAHCWHRTYLLHQFGYVPGKPQTYRKAVAALFAHFDTAAQEGANP